MGLAERIYKEGHAEGWVEGKEKAKLEIAKNMLAESISPNMITEVTELSLEKIKELQDKKNNKK